MNRIRRSIVGLGATSLLGLPLARAQKRPGPAHLVIADPMRENARANVAKRLAEAGFVEGRNLRTTRIHLVHAPNDVADARAQQIIASRPDVIFTTFGPEVVLLQHMTRDIPIVFHNCIFDPVQGGLIESVARPGRNITGSYYDYRSLFVKRWALYKEILPSLKRGAWITVAAGAETPRWSHRAAAQAFAKGFMNQEREAYATAERQLDIRIVPIVVPNDASEEQLIAAVRRERPQAVRLNIDVSENGPFERFLISERILSDLVVRAGTFPQESFYAGIDLVARVLRGESPATLPAVQGTRYVVKVNPRMAAEMKIAIPQSVLLQGEVVED